MIYVVTQEHISLVPTYQETVKKTDWRKSPFSIELSIFFLKYYALL